MPKVEVAPNIHQLISLRKASRLIGKLLYIVHDSVDGESFLHLNPTECERISGGGDWLDIKYRGRKVGLFITGGNNIVDYHIRMIVESKEV